MAKKNLHKVSVIRNLMIPLNDGISLAADLHVPDGKNSFPAIISYYPYHKDDIHGCFYDYPLHYFAEQGYACLMVDLRGTGSSGGLSWEPFDPREGKDAAEIIEWIACQPWCNGNVGMWGGSYGGITSLEAASQNPPHLKTIVPLRAYKDTYYDIAYPGGCLNCLSLYGSWSSLMLAQNLFPPTNADSDGRWYRIWKDRLGKALPYTFSWQEHPTYDKYWKSRAISVEKIKIPTFLIDGWRDIFPEGMVRIYERLSGPKKLVMGPWAHQPPDAAPASPLAPEPWDYLPEILRWWDYWLKGEKNGIMDEPPVTLFVQGSNIWKHEAEWPIARTKMRSFFLAGGNALIDKAPSDEVSDSYKTIPTVGAMAGLWTPIGLGVGYPMDQGPDDILSLTYTTKPLMDDVEITGSPEVVLYVAIQSGEDANIVAKLNDVSPDGKSSLITTGWLKASHYLSHEHPKQLKLGHVYEFRIPLWATSYLVAKGHQLRLSVSCSDFPHIFPTPTNPEISLFFGGSKVSTLNIPAIPCLTKSMPPPHMTRPELGINHFPLVIYGFPKFKIEQEMVNGTLTVTNGMVNHFALPSGGKLLLELTGTASVTATRPDGAKVESETIAHINMPTGEVIQIDAKSWVSEKRALFRGKVTIDGVMFFEKEWLR